ncbi:MAG: HK97 gp10 family phage protein [Nitrospirales bacterium]|nr:HK97 gp10 family phage protein [Nitrospirales bacterium]
MAKNNLHLDLRELTKWGKKAPKVLQQATRRALPKGGHLYANLVKRKMSGPVLKRRTGNLVRSVTVGKVEGTGGNLRLRVGSNLVYAPIHEFGKRVKPTRSKYLTIPLDAAKTAAGVQRFSARKAPGPTFVKRSKKGNLIIFRNAGGNLIPLFLLRKSVKIPKRPIWRPSLVEVREPLREFLVSEVEAGIRRS